MSRFLAGDAEALLELGDTDAFLELALGSLVSDYARGGLDAVVSGPPAGVRDEERLRAELATLVVDGDMPTRARAANRTLWLARELVQAADDEEARSEGLYRVGKALLDVDDAFRDWPRPWDPTMAHMARPRPAQ